MRRRQPADTPRLVDDVLKKLDGRTLSGQEISLSQDLVAILGGSGVVVVGAELERGGWEVVVMFIPQVGKELLRRAER